MLKNSKNYWVNTISKYSLMVVLATSSAQILTLQTAHAQTSADVIDEVIVVGSRLRGQAENVQDVPLAVTVISPDQLGAMGSPNIEDFENLTPNLVIDSVVSTPGGAAISIRGVSFEDVEKSFEPTVGVVIDGVFIGTNTGQLANTFDFEQIEVLRGPQGTLFGRNTIGGVVNIRRSRPTKEFGVKAEATLGSFGRQEYNGIVNVGIGDKVGLKLFGFDRSTDGYFRNITLDTDAGASSSTNIGAALLLEPNDNLDILLTVERSKLGGDPALSSFSNNTDVICNIPAAFGGAGGTNACNNASADDIYTTYGDVLGDVDYSEDSFTGEINYDFGDLKLTSITGYKTSDELVVQDFDASAADFFTVSRDQDYKQFSQEVRIAGQITDRISGVIGGYYFDNEYQLLQLTNLGPAPSQNPAGLTLPATTDHNVKSIAGFADFDFQLSDAFRLSAGARYSKDNKEFTRGFLELAPIAVSPFFAPAPVEVSNEDSWSEFTPRVSLDYKPNEDMLLYGSYSRGYRAGGFNGRANSREAVGNTFDPETVDAFELGMKNTLADGRVNLNLAAFTTSYNNKQEDTVLATAFPALNPQETVTLNVASATISGLEADLMAKLSDRFTLTGSLGLLDAKYDNFQVDLNLNGVADAGEDASTRDLRRAPKVSFSIAGNYTAPVGDRGEINLNSNFSTRSSYATTINPEPGNFGSNDARGLRPSETNLSASATYKLMLDGGQEVYIRGFGRNLTDQRGTAYALPVAGLFTFGSAIAPREYGVTVGAKF